MQVFKKFSTVFAALVCIFVFAKPSFAELPVNTNTLETDMSGSGIGDLFRKAPDTSNSNLSDSDFEKSDYFSSDRKRVINAFDKDYKADHIADHLNRRRSDDGNTPLNYAVISKNYEVANYLIQRRGVDTSIKNDAGDSPFISAVKSDKCSMVSLFFKDQLNPDISDLNRGIDLAFEKDNQCILDKLLTVMKSHDNCKYAEKFGGYKRWYKFGNKIIRCNTKSLDVNAVEGFIYCRKDKAFTCEITKCADGFNIDENKNMCTRPSDIENVTQEDISKNKSNQVVIQKVETGTNDVNLPITTEINLSTENPDDIIVNNNTKTLPDKIIINKSNGVGSEDVVINPDLDNNKDIVINPEPDNKKTVVINSSDNDREIKIKNTPYIKPIIKKIETDENDEPLPKNLKNVSVSVTKTCPDGTFSSINENNEVTCIKCSDVENADIEDCQDENGLLSCPDGFLVAMTMDRKYTCVKQEFTSFTPTIVTDENVIPEDNIDENIQQTKTLKTDVIETKKINRSITENVIETNDNAIYNPNDLKTKTLPIVQNDKTKNIPIIKANLEDLFEIPDDFQQKEPDIATINNDVNQFASDLNGFLETRYWTPSVWKNKEGKFNYARLASDSIAGVALGAVSGLITSNIIKKNQIKNGLEDLACESDSKTIAQWGDRFTIDGVRTKTACEDASKGRNNIFVWADVASTGKDFASLRENKNPDKNICWVRVEVISNDPDIKTNSLPARYFQMGGGNNCGGWLNEDTVKQLVLDAKKSKRTWGTIAGVTGGAAIGVGAMELFGNRAIGGSLQGQKSLSPEELAYSNMTDSEKDLYKQLKEKLTARCADLILAGGSSKYCPQ